MTRFTEEIVRDYQVRKTKNQKTVFRRKLADKMIAMGYEVREERHGFFGGTVNVTVGDTENAEYIFTAHYDTCAGLFFPNFITPRRPIFYVLYQLLIAVVVIGLALLVQLGVYHLTENTPLSMISYFVVLVGFFVFLLCGPANKHTANDNTSGVCVLCEALASLSPEEAQEGKIAFVFFDNEEMGLLGSAAYKKRHKKTVENQTIVNFDCIGEGDHFLFICSKNLVKDAADAEKIASCIENHPQRVNTVCASKGVVYPSDQANFKKSVGVAAFRNHPVLGLYMSKIHTKRDTVLEELNVELLKKFIVNTAKKGGGENA